MTLDEWIEIDKSRRDTLESEEIKSKENEISFLISMCIYQFFSKGTISIRYVLSLKGHYSFLGYKLLLFLHPVIQLFPLQLILPIIPLLLADLVQQHPQFRCLGYTF